MTTQTAAKGTAAKGAPAPAPASAPAEPAKRRGRKPGQATIKRDTDFSLDFLAAPRLASEDERRQAAPQRERSEVQRTMDAVVPKAHSEWVAAGRPSQWGKLPVVVYHVPPEKVDGLKYLIRRACDLHGVRARFGAATRDKSGLEVVAFAVMDKRGSEDEKD